MSFCIEFFAQRRASRMPSIPSLDKVNGPNSDSALWTVFSKLASLMGEDEAIHAPGRDALTFSELATQLSSTRRVLNDWGIGRGELVAAALPNGPETASAFLAVTASAIYAPLNPAYTGEEFRRYLSRLRPSACIVPAATKTPARDAARSLGITTLDLEVDEAKPAGWFTLSGGGPSTCKYPSWNTKDDDGLILLTSGTTAREKLVPLKLRHFLAYAKGINELYQLDRRDRCLSLNPMFHGGGLMAALLVPLVNGSGIVCPTGLDIATFFHCLDVYSPTWYIAGATIQNAILREARSHASSVAQSRLRFIRGGSGRLDPKIQWGLEEIFRAPVIHQYSASETIAITCNPLPPKQRKAGSVGLPVINEVRIIDAEGGFLTAGQEGEVVVHGPTVFEGYVDDSDATRAAFINGWYRTGDLGRFDADGYLTLSGRIKDVINRGGEKVAPAEVEAIVARHPAIRDVKIFGIPHPSLGEEVVAAVVFERGVSVSERELRMFAKENLAAFKVPRKFFFFEALPLAPTNKVDTKALAYACQQRLSSAIDPIAASSSVENELARIWRKVLERDTVARDQDFFLLGGDSLMAVELCHHLRSELGVRVPPDAMYAEAATLSGMTGVIERLLEGDSAAPASAKIATAAPTPDAAAKITDVNDLVTVLTLAALAPAAWLLPRRFWPRIAKVVARAHIAARGTRASRLEPALDQLLLPTAARDLERAFISGSYEEMMMMLAAAVGRSWLTEAPLHGGEHLSEALSAGGGAILWVCPFTFSGLVSKKVLSDAGFPLVALRSRIHPFSGTRLGARFINPVRTCVEDRYLLEVVALGESGGAESVRVLETRLDRNHAVIIAANGATGTPFEMPFMNGSLKLALGAPTLAVLHGAPVLPLFTVPDDSGGFEVFVEPPIECPSGGTTRERAKTMARAFAATAQNYVSRYPASWRSWFSDNTWSPRIE